MQEEEDEEEEEDKEEEEEEEREEEEEEEEEEKEEEEEEQEKKGEGGEEGGGRGDAVRLRGLEPAILSTSQNNTESSIKRKITFTSIKAMSGVWYAGKSDDLF